MEKNRKKEKQSRAEERRRYDYMIAWRERYIRRLQEILEGKEEELKLLNALLAVSLQALTGEGDGICAERCEGGAVLRIKKEAVRLMLGRMQASCTEEEGGFVLTLTHSEAPADDDGPQA